MCRVPVMPMLVATNGSIACTCVSEENMDLVVVTWLVTYCTYTPYTLGIQ